MSVLDLTPSISVVIPMYNSESSIYDTLLSVKNQTAFSNILEVLVINDGSTDNSLKVVESFQIKNMKFPLKILNKRNGGVSSARNLGMQYSSGEWIALLDSDDKWVSNKLEIQLKIVEENADIDFLGGNYDNEELSILGRKTGKLYKANIKDICIKMFPQSSTVIFKKRIFDEIGGYDENQKYAEDGNYYMNIIAQYNYYHVNEFLVLFGDGKPAFGFSGLSANLKEMHKGTIKNIKELVEKSLITKKFYLFLRVFYLLKYYRRIIITKRNKWRKK
ncbi:glycosyltransferase family 2 protein [Longirhabdus pacifica]|uniref:glycosyltransferase family 2 protein n=1 Tax=Longirhabdus pacifica TaxID=2305227 RepID=UPI0010086FFD|nr:glycosyltransferase family A protein [Longirhabdus pacifica]